MADVEAPPAKIDAHDPLPESNWFWRRVFVFALCTCVVIGEWMMVQAMINLAGTNASLIVGGFLKIIGWDLLIAWFAMTYYIVGTNAEAVVKIVQTAGLFKSGVVSTLTQHAASADGSTASATTTTGQGGSTGGNPQVLYGPSENTGLPDNQGTYAGPPEHDIPEPDPATPEEAPWPKS